jgi:UPF0755 protein
MARSQDPRDAYDDDWVDEADVAPQRPQRADPRADERRRGPMPRSPNEILEPARAPEPPRQRRRQSARAAATPGSRRISSAVRFLNGLLTLLVLLLVMAGGAIYYFMYQFDRIGPLESASVIAIPKGEGVNAVAERLEREGAVRDARIFVLGSYVLGANSKLKAGEYEFKKGASIRQVIETLVEGKAILLKVSIPEGKTSYQIVQTLNAQEGLSGDVKEIPAEGTLMPDTYRYSRGMDRNELISRMQADLKKYVAKQWEQRASDIPFTTPEEVMIMASIVEKETGVAAERDRVAGVFVNRIRKKMRLQTDPTIIYYLTGGKGPLGRGITRSELDQRHGFNTYQVAGLPPTPICNPGRAAIDAVLNPAKTNDIFFVADGTGGHAFAATISDHQSNVKKWRQLEKDTKAKQPETAEADDAPSAGPGVALEMDGVSTGVPEGGVAATTVATTGGAQPLKAGMTVDMPLPQRRKK